MIQTFGGWSALLEKYRTKQGKHTNARTSIGIMMQA
jgi:hypothetical protein